jgi:hypothetical protein
LDEKRVLAVHKHRAGGQGEDMDMLQRLRTR